MRRRSLARAVLNFRAQAAAMYQFARAEVC